MHQADLYLQTDFIIKQNIRAENAFEYLYKNFIPTIADFKYLVDWNTVLENKKKYQRETIKLYDSLIDKNSSNETIVNGYRIKILELLLALDDKHRHR